MWTRWALAAVVCLGVVGCESLQRKFTRKPKHPKPPPSPVVAFRDYSQTVSPLDRYRKHYVMFGYWNQVLLHALGYQPVNAKRIRHASTEALAELRILRDFVDEDLASRVEPLIEERAAVDRRLQSPAASTAQMSDIRRLLERHSREVRRELFWRHVEDRLRYQDGG